ncbi:protein O-mannosyl-transferase TMTC4 [Condylostylus longicornis]|uniref:protein O-mannosyl-transferase TMTC4 n=1 Tax=Condylostylus longicornis TaxID=2530218 RepID=UPI00244E2325|nr:protein O-mannosyl-transferase TMTC4 [Condylostylus longicornis]
MNIFLIDIILILFCFVCYFESLDGDFVFDDIVAIVKNKDVTTPYQSSISDIFYHDFWGQNISDSNSHKSYRPLTTLMFRIEYSYFKLGSFHMKFINLLLHCINTCLVYWIFRNVARTKNKNLELYAAIIFAVHPIHTEAVCGIVGRAELMYCLCFLISLLIFDALEDQKSLMDNWLKMFILIFVSFMGLFFKENAITILPTCIMYDIVLRTNLLQDLQIRLHVKKIVLKRFGILLIITCCQLYGRLYIQNFESPKFKTMDNPVAFNDNFFTRVLSQNHLYVLNFWILLNPLWLSFDWALGSLKLVTSVMDIRCITFIIFYYFLFKLLKTHSRLVFISLGLLIIPFLPAAGILKVGFVIAERILYVPSIGYCLLIVHGFINLEHHLKNCKMILKIFGLFILIVLIIRTRQRAAEWMTENTLFVSGLKVCPDNAKIHYNVAKVAADQNNRKIALKHYHKAISLYPEYESALMNLGNLYREIGDYDAAEKYLKKSIEILEEFPQAWMNLGIVYHHKKKYNIALECYENALKYRNRYPTCLYNMGNMFLEQQKYSEALKYWQESLFLNPLQSKAWVNMLTLLDNRKLYEDALRTSDRALSFLPNDTSIMFIRANVEGKLGNYIEAEQHYLKVISTNPSNALYHVNLGVLYHRWKKYDLAGKSYKKALSLDPDLKSAKVNLVKLLTAKQKED